MLTPDEFEKLLVHVVEGREATLDEDDEKYFDDNADVESIWGELKYDWGSEVKKLNDAGITLAASYGGEGQGDEYWVVAKYNGQYFRKSGWYASYSGAELDGDCEEVVPREVAVTEWVRK